VLDVEHDLALDQEVVVEGELVLGEVDGALDRVLDRHEAEVDLAAVDGVEHVGHRAVRDQVGRRQVGLGEERLLGERAAGTEEPHPRAIGVRLVGGGRRLGVGHVRTGYGGGRPCGPPGRMDGWTKPR
jgi:hypothetical protein